MSGTSGDGVDASIIQSDGQNKYKVILDKYFEYDRDIYKNIHELKENINGPKDLKNLFKEVTELEKKITLFHAKVVGDLLQDNIDFLGFHGFGSHSPLEALASRWRRKSMRNECNATQNTARSAPQPRNTPSNIPEPSRIDWSGQTAPRAEIEKKDFSCRSR